MMKRKMMTAVLMMTMAVAAVSGCGNANAGEGSTAEQNVNTTESGAAEGTVYKVGIVQYVDDASLNQIEKAIEAELDAKGAELGVTFDYADYTFNGQADQSI